MSTDSPFLQKLPRVEIVRTVLIKNSDTVVSSDKDAYRVFTRALPGWLTTNATVPRPYLKEVTLLPTEIKDDSTVTGRLKVTLYDEPDTDVGIDPYLAGRSVTGGTFFKKLLARNPNYKGRRVKVLDGFAGMLPSQFTERIRGSIETISLKDNTVTVECADALKDLSEIKVAPQVNVKLVANIDAVGVTITLDTLEGLETPAGHVRIGDEIVSYTSVDTAAHLLKGCTRGAFATTAEEHNAEDAVSLVRWFGPANPFDVLVEILSVDCGLTTAEYAADAFAYWKQTPGDDIPVQAVISEPTEANQLLFELADLFDLSLWVGEDLKITVRRNMPNDPDRSYCRLSDEANIILKGRSVDLNEESRFTRVLLYWDKKTLSDLEEINSYNRVDIAVDADAEGDNGYNDTIEKIIYCRWLQRGYLQEEILNDWIINTIHRRLINCSHARSIAGFSVELKDGAVKTGDYLLIKNDDLPTADGLPSYERYMVVKREPKGNVINLKVQQVASDRICFIAPDDQPDYDDADFEEREYGYIAGDDGLIDGKPGYIIW